MNISSTKSPYLLQIERINKPKATYGNRFRMALETEKAESQAKDAATDGLEEKDALQANTVPSYTLTEEMEDIYREMNGEPYKEDDPFALEEQDEEEKELSVEDAEIASRKNGLFFNESTHNDDIKSDIFDELAVSENTAGVDPLQAMEEMTGVSVSTDHANSLSDEDIKYFREKYGDMYNENTAGELYYDLADKGIISINDASSSSNTVAMIHLSAVKRVVYFGTHLIGRENMKPLKSFSDLTDDVVYIKDISREDTDAYKYEWESFKEKYDRDINTWKDALQESIDFERYLKEIAKNSASNKHYPSQWRFDNIIERLEKTKDVINQIFGEVTA